MTQLVNSLFAIPRSWNAILAFSMFGLAATPRLRAQGIPEPSLILYGSISNTADWNARVTAGPLTWQFRSGGITNTFAVPLTNVNDQFSYILRVPWETDLGAGVSSNTLRLTSTPITYDRSQIFLGTNPIAFVQPSQASFSPTSLSRGQIELADLQASIVCIDSDGNGLCDWWELLYFGRLGISPNGDADGDGLSNLAEYRAGTDPLDPNSAFQFINVTNDSPGAIRVDWSSIAGRVYTLQRSSSLTSGYTNLNINVTATEPMNTFRDTNAPSPGPYFYRLLLQP